MIRALLVIALAMALTACERPASPFSLGGEPEVHPTFVDQLDQLADENASVSVSGIVIEQEGDNGRRLVLDDGTGLIWVEMPEPPPPLVGLYFSASGPLERQEHGVVLQAREWLYDSTAVPAR